ncbi:Uncharacterised protein [Vibrio cholerae]|uniref:Uncharacterized protein n=1 Tax=Vibrio cholerae TaxID=666 RepID=A0A656ASR0_VIBCL|nr:Uncharacterised protein [Vibrio cholerae]CSB81867.1 Uncharacterised protein [Vibrio cholerae]CSC59439.1 Uncharacterised protein [Vibrio cholerae]CSC68747.1 Uncharacterised protein [Vibrio cholerae]CSD00917.1 Uncharacterised protein [Vibrio cholerae]
MINRRNWTQTHRYGWELPEFRHQFRVWVRRKTFAIHFLTEVVQLLFGQTAFNESTRVDPWRDVTLIVNQVATVFLVWSTEEVVETGFVESSGRLERSHVATQFQIFLRCTQHDHDRVPAND